MAMTNETAYLDNASATRMDPRVLEAMLPHMGALYGNPASQHIAGQGQKAALEGAREKVAGLINAEKPSEVVFSSGATESTNMLIIGAALRNKDRGNRILASKIEHISVLNTLKHLSKQGFEVVYIPVDGQGTVRLEALKESLTDGTILVTVGYASNEVGTIQPVREIAEIAHAKKAVFHTDATPAAGKIPIDVNKDGIDLMTFSSWDMYGPFGIGGAYVRKGIKMQPLIIGGGQEGGMRSGTENIAGAVGFGKAAELAKAEMPKDAEKTSAIRDSIVNRILKEIPASFLNGHPTRRLPNNANLRFSYIEGESLVLMLDMEGVMVASGSACSSKTLEPSHVLIAMGVPHVDAQGSLLVTLSRFSEQLDGDRLVATLPNIVKGLRQMSPIAPEEVK
jgi:cysteine desulfurase